MSDLERIRSICLALPGAYEKVSHGSPGWFVEKGGQFCIYADNHHNVGFVAAWIPAPPGIQEVLIAEDVTRFFRPPYVGPSGWIGVYLNERTDWEEVEAFLEEANQMKQPKRRLAPKRNSL
ncbi:MAG: MmcQ/YjbR family DNA-binding protein [Fimbriimonadaceae bacterium]|nr:MmcQ/YjbR family DNA-binding protein [Fimbriimonadaceae bacterium]